MNKKKREKEHNQNVQYIKVYIGFIVALLLILLVDENDEKYSLSISLFFLSLPSLIAIIFLDQTIRVIQNRKDGEPRVAIVTAVRLGFIPSYFGIVALIWVQSWISAFLFMIISVYWLFNIGMITALGSRFNSNIKK